MQLQTLPQISYIVHCTCIIFMKNPFYVLFRGVFDTNAVSFGIIHFEFEKHDGSAFDIDSIISPHTTQPAECSIEFHI